MRRVTRRSLIHGSVGLFPANTLARPFIANAAATTADVLLARLPGSRAVYESGRAHTILIPLAPTAC